MKTKAQMMWDVSKESEEEYFKESEKTWNFHRSHNAGLMAVSESKKMIDELKDLFKLIRGAEYRRGKEDGKKEQQKEILEKIESFGTHKCGWGDDSCDYINPKELIASIKSEDKT